MKKTAGLIAAVVLLAPVGACGGDGGSGDYCDQVSEASDSVDLEALRSNPGGLDEETFDDIVGQVDDITEVAPSDVEDDWRNLGDALKDFKSILDDAGLSISDLDALASGQPPTDLDPAKAQELIQRLTEFNSTDLSESTDAITKSAQDDCDVDFGGN